MDIVEKINQLAQEFMIAESDVSACRMLGGVGRDMHRKQEHMKELRQQVIDTFKESGYTIGQLEEMQDANGAPVLAYGVDAMLHRFLPYDD